MYFSDKDLEVGKKELEHLRDNYTATLEWVNATRGSYFNTLPIGDLPKGIRGDPLSCVIHNCFAPPGGTDGFYAGSATIYFMCRSIFVKYPPKVCAFVRDFDYGKYPELELTE